MLVSKIFPVEQVHFDSAPLHELIAQMGPQAAEVVADTAVEEVIELLSTSESAWRVGEFSRLAHLALTLEAVSGRVGMSTVSVVAGQVAQLCGSADAVALSAVMSRLIRVGDASIASLAEVSHM